MLIDECVWKAIGSLADGTVLWRPEQLHDPLVKRVDSWALAFEASHLMLSRGEGWQRDDGAMHPIPTDSEDCVFSLSRWRRSWRFWITISFCVARWFVMRDRKCPCEPSCGVLTPSLGVRGGLPCPHARTACAAI